MAVARYLADKSVWARLTKPAVRATVAPRVDRGLVGTCPIIDLEILYSARTGSEHDHFRAQRTAFEYFPMTDEIAQRAVEVQGLLAQRAQHRSVSIPDLLIAATAERYALTVLHYDGDYDRIATVTGQATEWVVPPGTAD
ncbi:MAG TPA: PIN domain nuclease [Streptosporangiaceae bacterium]|jgi:predicted nucleic acid-binding protein|nr:PIN domain nuclease [Streptosporangiaceae bacterium]